MSDDIVRGSIEVVIFGDDASKINTTVKSCINQSYKQTSISIIGTFNIEELDIDVNILSDASVESITFFDLKTLLESISSTYVLFIKAGDTISCDYLRILKNKITLNDDFAFGNLLFKGNNDYYYPNDVYRYQAGFGSSLDRYVDCYLDSDISKLLYGKLFSKSLLISVLSKLNSKSTFSDFILLTALFGECSECHYCESVYYKSKSDLNKKKEKISIQLTKMEEVVQLKEILNEETYNKLVKNRFCFLYRTCEDDFKHYFIKQSKCICDGLKYTDFAKHNLVTVPIDSVYYVRELIKKTILDDSIRVISFDVFDTLILRNVWEPKDIFSLMNGYFNDLLKSKSCIDYGSIRINAEIECRKIIEGTSYEEITFDQIYDQIAKTISLSKEQRNLLKEYEFYLEEILSERRSSNYELYDLAVYLNKRVICISDTYLGAVEIKKLLDKNGYSIDTVYSSADIKLCKCTGNLFKYVLKSENIKSSSLVHIGDNWVSDKTAPNGKGITAYQIPKPTDIFTNINPVIYGGNAFNKIFYHNTSMDARCAFENFIGIRCMLSLVCNKFFDNSIVNYNKGSDFNSNPVYIGYFALGMHILGLVKWLRNQIVNNKKEYTSIKFLGRDGYLVKEAYDILFGSTIKTDYVEMSRNIVHLFDMNIKQDLYSLDRKIDVLSSTPEKILEILDPIIECDLSEIKKISPLDRPFGSYEVYNTFIGYLMDNCFRESLLKEYKSKMKLYFSSIFTNGCCLFDLGYNGRVESALSVLLDYPVDSYYLHEYRDLSMQREKANNFAITSYYDYQPMATFFIREQMFCKIGPSLNKIEINNSGVVKKYKENFLDDYSKMITDIIQKSALEFIKDYRDKFSLIEDNLYYRCHDSSLPYEFYLNQSNDVDRIIFDSVLFDDTTSNNELINMYGRWKNITDPYNKQSIKVITTESGVMKKINKYFPLGSNRRKIMEKIYSKL